MIKSVSLKPKSISCFWPKDYVFVKRKNSNKYIEISEENELWIYNRFSISNQGIAKVVREEDYKIKTSPSYKINNICITISWPANSKIAKWCAHPNLKYDYVGYYLVYKTTRHPLIDWKEYNSKIYKSEKDVLVALHQFNLENLKNSGTEYVLNYKEINLNELEFNFVDNLNKLIKNVDKNN